MSSTADREIVLSRLLDAPRELVFAAWTDPKQIVQWWGPRGFTTTTQQMSVTPGGVWRFVMHGLDGTDYKNKIIFTEVVKPERLIYRHAGEENTEDVKFHVTVTFKAQGPKTLLTMRSLFETAQERDDVVTKYGAIEGGKQTLERLAEHVEKKWQSETATQRCRETPSPRWGEGWGARLGEAEAASLRRSLEGVRA